MKRTVVLFVLSVSALVAALLVPVYVIHGRIGPSPAPKPAPQPPPPLTSSDGSLTIRARPARHSFLASGDSFPVVFEITASRPADQQRRPVNLALVLDRSGSMTGEPLRKAKEAAKALVQRLTPEDRLAIVHFGSDAVTALRLTPMDEDGRDAAARAIDRIEAAGGTNTSGGLSIAEADLADADPHAIRRLILLSDGEANEGLVGAGLVSFVRRQSDHGLRVSALGLGVDFDEDLMMKMADAGGGQYRYLKDADEVASALTEELSEAAGTAATNISLLLTHEDDVLFQDAAGLLHESEDGGWSIRLNDMASGETRHVTLTLRAHTDGSGSVELARARLTYDDVPAGYVHRVAEAAATATATHDASEVARSYDREAARVALRARWGTTMMDAARQYRSNNPAAAIDVKNEAAKLAEEAKDAQDDAFAQQIADESVRTVNAMAAAPSASSAGSAFRKSLATMGRSYAQ
jgi:Ca-activated chloride channel family protein